MSARVKSEEVMQRGASCSSVRGSGWALRKCAIVSPAEDWKEMSENGAVRDVDIGMDDGNG